MRGVLIHALDGDGHVFNCIQDEKKPPDLSQCSDLRSAASSGHSRGSHRTGKHCQSIPVVPYLPVQRINRNKMEEMTESENRTAGQFVCNSLSAQKRERL